MIEVRNLSKRFGRKVVLKKLNLDVAPGEIVALLGANGAGKTTLLRILATLAKPSLGKVTVAGAALPGAAVALRAKVGFLGHKALLYGDLSAEQNLHFFARLYALEPSASRVDEVLELVALSKRRRDPLRIFSRGMQQRLAIGRAILHRPEVLLLDEAHTGLDQDSVTVLNGLLQSLAEQDCTILMASHDLARVTQLAARVDVLAAGKISASYSRAEIAKASLPSIYAQALRAAEGSPRGN